MRFLAEILKAIGYFIVISCFSIFMTAIVMRKACGSDYMQTQNEIRELNKSRTWATIDSPWRADKDRKLIELEEKSRHDSVRIDTLWKPTSTEVLK